MYWEGGREISDDQIVRRILSGDEEAVRLLVERYWPHLYRVVFSIVRHPKDAEDITQEAFLQIFLSLPRYRFSGLKSWMTRIAVNKSIDFKRRAKRQHEELTGMVEKAACAAQGVEDDVEQQFAEREIRRLLRNRLAQIPEPYRSVVFAYYIEGKSYRCIADELGLAVKTVESRLYRAKTWMRQHWKEEEFR